MYFTPPPSPTEHSGKFDLVVTGLDVGQITIQDYVEYIDDTAPGIKQFSRAISVSHEEVLSAARFKKGQEGLTGQQAVLFYRDKMTIQFQIASLLLNRFLDQKEIDSAVVYEFQQLGAANGDEADDAVLYLGQDISTSTLGSSTFALQAALEACQINGLSIS